MTLAHIIQNMQKFGTIKDVGRIESACSFAQKAHEGQKRLSGEPYIVHPIAVALQLAQLQQDEDTIIAGLLHDVLEDTSTSETELYSNFGDTVFYLVKGVTKVHYFYDQENLLIAKNLKRFFQAAKQDVRILIIKLIDRLNNMQTLHYYSDPEKQKKKALETYAVYVPLAGYAGLFPIGNELSDLCLRYLEPETYLHIQQKLKTQYTSADADIDAIIHMLSDLLKYNHIKGDVMGRLKSISSVWEKMQNQVVHFNQLSDIIGFRILVETVEECYHAQQLLAKEFKVVSGSFKDYIRMPKNNHYQSLHCTFSLPPYEHIEVQIRTYAMNDLSENGTAHHALYKQRYLESLNPFLSKLLKHVLPKNDISIPGRHKFSREQLYCFTPNGDVIFLPKNSTCLDFASKIHSEIRDNATYALVNGQKVPLDTPLKIADEVYIYTPSSENEYQT
jgi:guanosine-3',5'-bis(diphosphate) 3'-pyrophosphohydrolase